MDLGLTGKRALVTGASSGIGRACAVELAGEGAQVCLIARDEKRLSLVREEIEAAGGRAVALSADLSTEDGCKRAVDYCVEALGGLNILINVAGSAENRHVLQLPVGMLDEAFGLKLYGYLRLSQLAIPHMQGASWGRIVNIAGSAGTGPTATNLPASFANAAVLNLTRALSDVVSRDNILVNAICPGLTNTPRARQHRRVLLQDQGREPTEAAVDALFAEATSALPAGRAAEPEEVARVACFLASEACSYVYASAVYMDGGARRATP